MTVRSKWREPDALLAMRRHQVDTSDLLRTLVDGMAVVNAAAAVVGTRTTAALPEAMGATVGMTADTIAITAVHLPLAALLIGKNPLTYISILSLSVLTQYLLRSLYLNICMCTYLCLYRDDRYPPHGGGGGYRDDRDYRGPPRDSRPPPYDRRGPPQDYPEYSRRYDSYERYVTDYICTITIIILY